MKVLARNKRATFDYDLVEKMEGGLVLTGPEVKSAKAGQAQLKGAFLHVEGGELWLKNAYIAKYPPAASVQQDYDPYQRRKVLVRRRELDRLMGQRKAQGLTLVPISLILRRNLIKVEFALARGKRKHEKREAMKKRDVERDLRERMKG